MTLRRLAGSALLGVGLSACALLLPLPKPTSLSERLAVLPTRGLPLEQPVAVYWNEHQVPFIEARTDRDLAVVLGLVHAHLRLGQMEILRRISQGRVAEMAGVVAADIDHALRILDFGAAVPEIIAGLPADTRDWLDGFVQGINYYQDHADDRPHEFTVLGLRPEPWTIADLLAIGRLASADVNWIVWFQLLRQRGRADWPALWARLLDEGGASLPSYAAATSPEMAALGSIIAGLSRSGSNSVAVAGSRSASGGALIANDPHLGIQLPNLWLLAGYKSPSYHAVGLMIPGLPFIAVGRNPWIAWGGTNMRAASSDLFDVSELDGAAIDERRERIAIRWWFDREVTVRRTAWGPIISDAPMLDSGPAGALALRWMGHRPSDEMTALLRVSRARSWHEFRAALSGFAVSGQNMLYADAEGHIGQVMAVHLPSRTPDQPADLILARTEEAPWRHIVTSQSLPASFDPPQGFLASANNRGADAPVAIGYFFSPNDRVSRLSELVSAKDAVTLDDLGALQRDVFMASAVELREVLVRRLSALSRDRPIAVERQRLVRALADWDGQYAARSTGALAFELVLHHFARAYYDEERLSAYTASGRILSLVRADLEEAGDAALAPAFEEALSAAAKAMGRFEDWGAMHRLRLAHPLSFLPVIGRRYRFTDLPAAGGRSTIMKTSHRLTGVRHATSYGSNARHISDMSDPDLNYFVLLGGQDGRIASSTFVDQLDLWQRGAYIQLPLRLETVRAQFPHRTEIRP